MAEHLGCVVSPSVETNTTVIERINYRCQLMQVLKNMRVNQFGAFLVRVESLDFLDTATNREEAHFRNNVVFSAEYIAEFLEIINQRS